MPSHALKERIASLQKKAELLAQEIKDLTELIDKKNYKELSSVLSENEQNLKELRQEIARLQEQCRREEQEEAARLARLRPNPDQDPLAKLRKKEITKIEELNTLNKQIQDLKKKRENKELVHYYEQQANQVRIELAAISQQLNTLYLQELANLDHAKKPATLLKHAKVMHEIKKSKITRGNGALYQDDQPLNFIVRNELKVVGDELLYQQLKKEGHPDQQLTEMGLVKEVRTWEKNKTPAANLQIIFNNQKIDRQLRILPALSLQHLKDFLGSAYNEKVSLRVNVKKAFADPAFVQMLQGSYLHVDMSNAVNGVRGGGDFKFIIHPETGIKDEAILNNLIDRTCDMIENEQKNSESYALYSGVNSLYAVYQDVMTQLRSEFDLHQRENVFRLFKENFTYTDAEALRKKIFEIDKKDDNSPLFGQMGLCCSLSPLQASFHESAMDFWAHDKNNGSFDVLNKVILPKLGITDANALKRIQDRFHRIDALSLQLGGRMQQIFITKEDLDKYTWLSGRNGHKLLSVKKDRDEWVPTDKVSEALAFYRQDPQEFIQANRELFDQIIHDKTTYPRPGEVYYPDELSSPREPRNDNKYLGQLQARLYLHPELMHSDRIKINAYYGLPVDPAVVQRYQQEVSALATDILQTFLHKVTEGEVSVELADEMQSGKPPLLLLHRRCSPQFYQEALKRQYEDAQSQEKIEIKPQLVHCVK